MKQRRHRQKLQKAQNNAHERRTAYPTPLKAHPRIGIGRESECHFPSFRFLSFYFHFLSCLSFGGIPPFVLFKVCSVRTPICPHNCIRHSERRLRREESLFLQLAP